MEPIVSLIQTAFDAALRTELRPDAPGHPHHERSRLWVEALADQFRLLYAGDLTVRVFSKHHDRNRAEFLLNELLYDVCVCRIGAVASASLRKKLFYVAEALWQVESEFAMDSRKALVDFNKLVLGSAHSKLFIGPQVRDIESFINVLLPPAAACIGEIFLALLPHPKTWSSSAASAPLLWHFASGAWCSMQGNQ